MSFTTHLNRSCCRLSVALVVLLSSNAVSATETQLAAELIETTGVAPHLADASNVIFAEALPKYSRCLAEKNLIMSKSDEQALKQSVDQHLGKDVVVARAVNALNQAMNSTDMKAVQAFFNSPIGVRIVSAEFASKGVDEKSFTALMDRHLNSAAWDETRIALIEAVYESTRAARFVSTLNGEILVASTLSAHCDASDEGFDKLQFKLDMFRSESKFIEPIMRGDLLPVVATVFRNLPNSDLEAYSEFAQSELGVAFFDALISSTASSLSDGLPGLRVSLQRP